MKQSLRQTCLLAALCASGAFAAGASQADVSARMQRRAGAYVGVLGDPSPTLVGVNVAYNLTDFMRASAGIGQVSIGFGNSGMSATTIGAAARFLVPGWNLSPVAGLSAAVVSVTEGGSISGFSGTSANVSANVGVDWQTEGGFNIGLGYNISFVGDGNPYLNLGWFFDFI